MKDKIKPFMAGVLIASILINSVPVFAEYQNIISVVFDRVKLFVDGNPVDGETLLYNGVTYVPLRAVAEILGKEVVWQEETQSVYIQSAGANTVLTPHVEVEDDYVPEDDENIDKSESSDIEDSEDNDAPNNEMLTYEYEVFTEENSKGNDVVIKQFIFSDGVIVAVEDFTRENYNERQDDFREVAQDNLAIEMREYHLYEMFPMGTPPKKPENEVDTEREHDEVYTMRYKNDNEDFTKGNAPDIRGHRESGIYIAHDNQDKPNFTSERVEYFLYNYKHDKKKRGIITGQVYFSNILDEISFNDGIHKCTFYIDK
jgi:hypothetical protein